MSIPAWLVLSLGAALAVALMYQIASRHYGWRILAYWGVALVGFLGAEVLAESLGVSISRFGDLRLGPDVAGAGLAMVCLWVVGL